MTNMRARVRKDAGQPMAAVEQIPWSVRAVATLPKHARVSNPLLGDDVAGTFAVIDTGMAEPGDVLDIDAIVVDAAGALVVWDEQPGDDEVEALGVELFKINHVADLVFGATYELPTATWLTSLRKAVWSTAYVNDLPDSAFLIVLPGGEKDDAGKTVPRSLRMFPVYDADGEVDLPHLRNALARIPQSNRIDQATKDKLAAKAKKLLDEATAEKAVEIEKVPAKYDHIDFTPPQGAADAAEKGLEYRKKAGGKGGLSTAEAGKQGIGSGVARATSLKNRQTMAPATVRQMKAFFDRHEKNRGVAEENRGEPWNDRGHVAWLLWGGDAGRAWANKVVRQMDAADEKSDKGVDITQIIKADETDERYVLGVVLEPDTVDSQGDMISAAEIRQAAHRYMQSFGNVGLQHQVFVNDKIKILESFIAPVDFEIGGQLVKSGTWLMAFRVLDDSIWKAVKDGVLGGLSIGGTGVRRPVSA